MKILSLLLILGTTMISNIAFGDIKTANTMDEIHTIFKTTQMETKKTLRSISWQMEYPLY